MLSMNFFMNMWISINVVQIANGNKIDQIREEMTDEEAEIYYNKTYSDTECLFNQEEGVLASADGINFTFPENSIFFIETSCKGGLDFRQACSVETAARTHESRQINVLFAGRDTTNNVISQNFLKTLLTYKNVKFYKVHIGNYAKGTPLEEIVKGKLKESRYLLHHASDVLRFLTLYKYGGIYLDLDVIVVKSLDHLPVKKDWIGREVQGVAVGLVALSRSGIGKEIVNAIIKNLETNFDTRDWGANGIIVTTEALEKVCSIHWKKISPATCKGFKIYEPRYFYPINSDYYESFLEPLNKTLNLTNVYAFHLWNYLMSGEDIYKNSLHAALTKKYCPKIDKVNYKFTNYDISPLSSPQPQQMRTIRVQRSRVDTLYNTIEINLKEKLLDMKKKGNGKHTSSSTEAPNVKPRRLTFKEKTSSKVRWIMGNYTHKRIRSNQIQRPYTNEKGNRLLHTKFKV